MTRSAVLILSKDPVVGALLGAAVELVGFEPTFPDVGETAVAALRRTRSPIAFVDAGREAEDVDMIARATITEGARPILFAPMADASELAIMAARVGAPSFTVPSDHRKLADLLRGSE